MLEQQYKPFLIATQELSFNLDVNTLQQDNGCIDRYKNFFVVKGRNHHDEIFQTLLTHGVQSSFDLKGLATPFVRLDNDRFLTFVPQNQTLHLIDFGTEQMTEIQLKEPSKNEDSHYSLHAFSRSPEIFLAQKSKERNSIKLTHFNYSPFDSSKLIDQNTYESYTQKMWSGQNVFEITPYGRLGWCATFKAVMEMWTFDCGEGFNKLMVNLNTLEDFPGEEQFRVLAMWQIDNFLFAVINPVQSVTLGREYSPIIRIDLKGSLEPVFVKVGSSELVLRECLQLQDYVILFAALEMDGSCNSYVFDKKSQQIVNEQQVSIELKPIKTSNTNSYLLLKGNTPQIIVIQKTVKRVCSLSYQRVLSLTEQAVELANKLDTAIIIFGRDKTGKSTLRHYLAGERLIHRYNQQFGFNEVVTQVNEMAGLEHEEQREWLPWMNTTEHAAIVDVPDWRHRGNDFALQVKILLARLFRTFRQLHFLVTIPEEYISDSYENEEFLSAVLSLIGKDSLHQSLSIVLTKVESSEDSLLLFNEHIEEIMEINESSGNLMKSISEQSRILTFENRQVDQNEGSSMLQRVLGFERASLMGEQTLSVEQELKDSSFATIFFQEQYYISLVNAYLQMACHKLAPHLFPFAQQVINARLSQGQTSIDPSKQLQQPDNVAPLLVNVLAQLRNLLIKQEKSQSKIAQLKEVLIKLAETLDAQLTQNTHFGTAVQTFIASIRNATLLPLQRPHHTYAPFISIMQHQPDGILGQSLRSIIAALQTISSVQTCAHIGEFTALFGKSLPKVKRVVYVEMSFEEERKEVVLRNAEILKTICQLPCNALKLDLICQQLQKYSGKDNLEERDYKPLRFYLREASRICEYHGLYYEAIVLLFVVPDFKGIEKLVEQLAQHLKRTTPYQAKKLLNSTEDDLIKKLLTLARDCLRDGLAKKLINLLASSSETSTKPAILRKDALTKAQNYLANPERIKDYQARLARAKTDVKEFYNLADPDFGNLLAHKQALVQRCIEVEEQEASKRSFQDTQALRFILDELPIPS